jgi:hypothetical protein
MPAGVWLVAASHRPWPRGAQAGRLDQVARADDLAGLPPRVRERALGDSSPQAQRAQTPCMPKPPQSCPVADRSRAAETRKTLGAF